MTNLKPKRIFLARHGQSVANQQKLISGQLDTPLSEKGQQQAQWLCDVLKNEPLSAIYASSLSRAMQTAQPTAMFHGLDIHVQDNLKEIHFGLLQGRPADGIDFEPISARGGESLPEFERRITDCLALLLQNLPVCNLIVAHRNTNAVILSQLLGIKAVNVKNKYLYEIVLGDAPTINTIRLGGEFHGKKYVGLKNE